MARGLALYTALLSRPPDLSPHDDFHEWEIRPTVWLQVAQGASRPAYPVRFGVADIEATRRKLIAELEIECSEIERIDHLVAWCSFTDFWGNHLGLYQDLADGHAPIG